MWNYFLRSARLHFGDQVVEAIGLRWVDHGQPLIEQLVRNFAATAGNRYLPESDQSLQLLAIQQNYKLMWGPGDKLDLQQVHLVRKRKTSKCHPTRTLSL